MSSKDQVDPKSTPAYMSVSSIPETVNFQEQPSSESRFDESGVEENFTLNSDYLSHIESQRRYDILQEITRGGSGIIYKAYDQRLQRIVAVKILRQEHLARQKIVNRFLCEAKIMTTLDHPGMIPVYDHDLLPDGKPFYVMKFLEGDTLYSLLHGTHRKKLTFSSAINAFARACHTMAHAHFKGVVHLDLSSSNIMLGGFESVYVVDWGLARIIPGADKVVEEKLTKIYGPLEDCGCDSSTFIGGTAEYLSPEQARCQTVDARSDVFSLGAILCEILTGAPPYHSKLTGHVFDQAVNADLEQAYIRLNQSGFDSELVDIAISCLQENPALRPANASELAKTISHYEERVTTDFKRFFNLSHDLYCIASMKGYYLKVNQTFQEILGYSEKEILSQSFLNFIHPEDVESTIQCMKSLEHYEPVTFFRNRYISKSGNTITLEWTAKRVPNEDFVYAIAKVIV